MGRGGKRIYHVRLDDGGRTLLQRTVDGGKGSVTRRRRAHILLLADANRDGGGRDDSDMADVPEAGASTVERARKRFGLDGGGQAMLACSEPPEGHARRSPRLPGDRLVELEVAESIPEGTVRQGLKETTSNRGGTSAGASRRYADIGITAGCNSSLNRVSRSLKSLRKFSK